MPHAPNSRDYKKLDAIDLLMRRHRTEEAQDQAAELVKDRPGLVEAWQFLAQAAEANEDNFTTWNATRQCCRLDPSEESYWHNLAALSLNENLLFLARQTVDDYQRRFPHGMYRERIAEMHKFIEEAFEGMIASGEFGGVPDYGAWALLETGRYLTAHGRTEEGRRKSLEAAQQMPGIAAPLNNVALSYTVEGDFPKALQTLEQVLAVTPDNGFAQMSRIQILERLGRSEEAHDLLKSIVQNDPDNADYWVKLIETCAMLHEHALLIDVHQRTVKFCRSQSLAVPPICFVWAGSAQAFLGDVKAANQEWKLIPRLVSLERTMADSIIHDLGTFGPWYFPIQTWVPHVWIERLIATLERSSERENTYRREAARLLEKTPGMITTLSLLLERGDPDGREFALNISDLYPLPGLVEFATSSRGDDQTRMQAAQIALAHGLLPRMEPVTLIIEGKPTEQYLISFEITTGTKPPNLPKPARKHFDAAEEALTRMDAAGALAETGAGLQIAPGDPALINVQINALRMLERPGEADALARQLADAHPDYLFARIEMAGICIREKNFDEAQDWLKPVLRRDQLHMSEFRALGASYVNLYNAKGDIENAGRWVTMLDDILQDSAPDVPKQQVNLTETSGQIARNRWKRPQRRWQ